MSRRPLSVTVAAILLVLLSLFDFPWPYEILFPGADEAPAFILYSGYVVGIAGLVAAIGLWMQKSGATGLLLLFVYSTSFLDYLGCFLHQGPP